MDPSKTHTSALANLTVVDLTTQLPGPYCSMILADLGARVIKIEPPDGDPLRAFPPMFASVNRGKQSMALNLKTEAGQAVLLRLIEHADAVLEGFRPDVAARLGADYDTVCAANPGVIYCSISGFGQQGPYRERAGHDINYLSFSGLLSQTGQADGRPVVPPVFISDLSSGLYAAIAILAALHYRHRTGHGQYIDLSMTESVIAWMAPEIARAHAEASVPDRPLLSGLPHYDVFETADGQFLSLGIVYESHFWQRLCDATGLEAWRDLTTGERMQRRDEIRAQLRQLFRTRIRDEWIGRLQEADVPCGPVYTLDELASDPQFLYRNVFRDIPASDGTVSRQTMPPFRFSRLQIEPTGPPPDLGAHSRGILRQLGYSQEEVKRLEKTGTVGRMKDEG